MRSLQDPLDDAGVTELATQWESSYPLDFVTKIGFPTTWAAGIGDNDSIQIWHVEQP